jgi:hypothetical protein
MSTMKDRNMRGCFGLGGITAVSLLFNATTTLCQEKKTGTDL